MSSPGRASEPAARMNTSLSGTDSLLVNGIGAAQGLPLGAARPLLEGGSVPPPPKGAGSTNRSRATSAAACSSGDDVITSGPDVAVEAPSGAPMTMAGSSLLARGEQPVRPPKATTAAARHARMRFDVTMTAPPPSPPASEGQSRRPEKLWKEPETSCVQPAVIDARTAR